MKLIKAFTLLELIISSAIVVVVGAAVYAVFSGGLSAWRRSGEARHYQRSLRLVSEVMTRELRNTFVFSQIPFKGTKDFISFVSRIEELSSESPHAYYQLGRVSYFVNKENILCRRQQSYAEFFQDPGAGAVRELVSGVKEIAFSYLDFDAESQEYEWREVWLDFLEDSDDWENVRFEDDWLDMIKNKNHGIPKAVKVEVTLEKTGSDVLEFNKTIMLPLGGNKRQKR